MESNKPLGYLLLRDGHAVPIFGLDPADLKRAAHGTIEHEGVELKHQSTLNAIVGRLGFDGDFGQYTHRHWPMLGRLLAERGVEHCRNLFEIEPNSLMFRLMERRRRALADRIFCGPKPTPRRAFVGHGHDWETWERVRDEVVSSGWGPEDDAFEPRDMEETRRWICRHRAELQGVHNFLGDQLLDLGAPGTGRFDAQVYFPKTANQADRDRTWIPMRKVMDALRWFLDRRDDGWIEIIPVPDNESLVLLKGPDRGYDLLWRNLREEPPPAGDPGVGLHPLDAPSSMQATVRFADWYYHRERWQEKDEHEAEKHYYELGGKAGLEYPEHDVILERYLRDSGVPATTPRLRGTTSAPDGSSRIEGAAGPLFVSEMITLREFRRFADDTSYFERRSGESWTAANDGNRDEDPVGATYLDALAFCAWKERALGVAVRLLTLAEHRAVRPFPSEHYRQVALGAFPWEHYPPRFGLEPSVLWSVPRFVEPGPGQPEFHRADASSSTSRKEWIANESWPPGAAWRDPIVWTEHAGLRFIDAWDAYEWCAGGRIGGRYWEGVIGPRSWGEYKNAKVGFRIVVEQEVHHEAR